MTVSYWYRPRIYVALVVLLSCAYGILSWYHHGAVDTTHAVPAIETQLAEFHAGLDQHTVSEAMRQYPLLMVLSVAVVIIGVIVYVAGIVLDFRLVSRRAAWIPWFTSGSPYAPSASAVWSLGDIPRIVILALSCMAMFPLVEGGLVYVLRHVLSIASLNFLVTSTYLSGLLVLCMLWLAQMKGVTLRQATQLTFDAWQPQTRQALVWYMMAIPLIAVSLWLSTVAAAWMGYEPPSHPLTYFFLEETRQAWLWYGVFFACVCAPIVEELFFRGIIFRALRTRCSLRTAACISGLLFGALHGNWVSLLPITVLGMVLALVAERAGTLYASILIHGVHNGIMVALMFGYRAFLQALGF
jgi:membrane protease YdiL (CAAX protease family)